MNVTYARNMLEEMNTFLRDLLDYKTFKQI